MKEINYNTKIKHYAYPSINAFRGVIKHVQDKTRFLGLDDNGDAMFDNLKPLPTLKAVGTTKLHGTNASIALHLKDELVAYQSRENILTPLNDNYGFAGYMSQYQSQILKMAFKLIDFHKHDFKPDVVIIFGEWCGGSIQKSVALNGLEKMFVIFDIRLYNEERGEYMWLTQEQVCQFRLPEFKIYNIYDFKTWTLDIDFNIPELSQNKLQEITLEIEEECPVASELGNKGIGEGAVWRIVGDGYADSGFWMKVKGEKHSVSKVKTLAPIDIEKVNSLREFVETYVTDNRCRQSISKLQESGIKFVTRQHLGDFIRWIHNDIVKEELDTIQGNNFEVKDLGAPIANASRKWFFENETTL